MNLTNSIKILTIFFRLKDSQILANLLDVCAKESVEYTEDGMEAIIFTAQVKKKKVL
jgi:DNA polymerase III delta prime subunit